MKPTHVKSCHSPWPELNYESWKDTLKTLHMWTQIAGKIRLRSMPWQNHSWHTSLYVTPRGLSTSSIPYQNGLFELEFDFHQHQLVISTTYESPKQVGLYPRSVADFYRELLDSLDQLAIRVPIHAAPNEVPESIPFDQNEQDRSYDAQKVSDYWQVAVQTNNIFQQFRSGFIGKCSPVHFFWGAFDLAVTRFSGRPAPLHPGEAPNMPKEVMQEAYSHEVSSAGFWPGGDQFPQPAFYSYCYPTPPDFGQQKVEPSQAFFSEEMGEFFLLYDEVRKAANPETMLMKFLQTTYEAAASTGKWDRKNLER